MAENAKPRAARRVMRVPVIPYDGPANVPRAELRRLFVERGQMIEQLQHQLEALSVQVQENRRELRTQFARMAQMQQEIETLKRRT